MPPLELHCPRTHENAHRCPRCEKPGRQIGQETSPRTRIGVKLFRCPDCQTVVWYTHGVTIETKGA